MFEAFDQHYGSRVDPHVGISKTWQVPQLVAHPGYVQFAQRWAGRSFAKGLYRIHDEVTGPAAAGWLVEAFPAHSRDFKPFGFDWLGRQFALSGDPASVSDGPILMFEPGTGEVLEIPVDFVRFHDEELIEYSDAALAEPFFESWRLTASTPPLRADQCAGYRVPLFLGGQDGDENLELVDIEVYWELSAQLIAATR